MTVEVELLVLFLGKILEKKMVFCDLVNCLLYPQIPICLFEAKASALNCICLFEA